MTVSFASFEQNVGKNRETREQNRTLGTRFPALYAHHDGKE